jgi:hypothetical protein
MKEPLDSYRDQRDKFLSQVVTNLSKDERFVAGWLTGSFSRGDADSVSDIDLSLVVSDKYCPSLCKRIEQVSAQTSPERYLLFRQFGSPALIHENNNNAPDGGTMTFVLYANSAVMVDWILIPESEAKRPAQSTLLFDKVGIPTPSSLVSEPLEQRKKSVAEKWAFFWMMTAITIKYMIRDDGVFVTQWIENLQRLLREIERQVNGESWSYTRGSLNQIQISQEKQIQLLKKLCQRMQELQPRVADFIGMEPMMPLTEIEILSSFVNDLNLKS